MSQFDPSRSVLPQASDRLQHWSLKLAMYQYTIKFCPPAQHVDALSRLPLPEVSEDMPVPGEFVLLIDHLAEAPISVTHLKSMTAKDPLLAKILQFIRYDWPNHMKDTDLKPYFAKRWELTELDGCIIWCTTSFHHRHMTTSSMEGILEELE